MELTLRSPKAALTRVGAGRAGRAAARAYRILRTTQVDGYEAPVPRAMIAGVPRTTAGAPRMMAAPVGDRFSGKVRKAAKTSISSAKLEKFTDVRALIESLPTEADMVNHTPKISKGETSERVKEEKRTVQVRAWLYAASRENDNDFHLIIGRSPSSSPMYMTVEVSGLTPAGSQYHGRLKRARNAYKSFFKDHPENLPGMTYDFYDPPIPVEIKGSLFFDVAHVTAGRPGPEDLRDDIPTVWEIHPVTRIVFEP